MGLIMPSSILPLPFDLVVAINHGSRIDDFDLRKIKPKTNVVGYRHADTERRQSKRFYDRKK